MREVYSAMKNIRICDLLIKGTDDHWTLYDLGADKYLAVGTREEVAARVQEEMSRAEA